MRVSSCFKDIQYVAGGTEIFERISNKLASPCTLHKRETHKIHHKHIYSSWNCNPHWDDDQAYHVIQ